MLTMIAANTGLSDFHPGRNEIPCSGHSQLASNESHCSTSGRTVCNLCLTSYLTSGLIRALGNDTREWPLLHNAASENEAFAKSAPS